MQQTNKQNNHSRQNGTDTQHRHQIIPRNTRHPIIHKPSCTEAGVGSNDTRPLSTTPRTNKPLQPRQETHRKTTHTTHPVYGRHRPATPTAPIPTPPDARSAVQTAPDRPTAYPPLPSPRATLSPSRLSADPSCPPDPCDDPPTCLTSDSLICSSATRHNSI